MAQQRTSPCRCSVILQPGQVCVHPTSRFVFLVNAAAGTGAAPRRLAAMLTKHPAIAARARVIATRTPKELDGALRLSDDEVAVSVGGDGSFNALVRLLDSRGELSRTVGIVPFGTGNATAHTLGLRNAAVAFRALDGGATSAVDLMRTSVPAAPIALVSCSTGFESNFLERYAALRYTSRSYAGVSALVRNVSRRMRGVSLTVDGTAWVDPGELVHNVGVYNIPHYAFGKVMWRGMLADDGYAIAAAATSPLWYWNLIARGITAPNTEDGEEHRMPGVRTIRFRTATLTSAQPLQIDGEAIEATEATLTVDARALTVIRAT